MKHIIKIKYLIISILSLLYIFIFFSCEKNANNVELPKYTAKLVLHAFLSPSDTVINVMVETTKNIYGIVEEYPETLPVKLILISDNDSIPFSPRDNDHVCSLKYNVIAGKNYKIIAQCKGYPDASAICRVPEIKDINILVDTVSKSYDYMVNGVWGSYQGLSAIVKFQDIADEIDYYNIEAFSTSMNSIYGTISSLLSIADKDGNIRYNNLISDHLTDGQMISTNFGLSYFKSDTSEHSLIFNADVLHVDSEYYRYHNSLSKYKGSDNPFTEFSPVYSNIEGGYGIFCAYVKYEKSIKIK
jgi:hypothetical protein